MGVAFDFNGLKDSYRHLKHKTSNSTHRESRCREVTKRFIAIKCTIISLIDDISVVL